MTDKNSLKQKLEETKAKLKANSKDAHYADALISNLLSLKAQLLHEPTLIHIPMSDVSDSQKGDTFEISIINDARAVYHVYGGYTIIADPRAYSLNQTIMQLVELMRTKDELTDEQKENSDWLEMAIGLVLSVPNYVFADDELTFEVANLIIKHLEKLQEKMFNAELPAEDEVKNSELELVRNGLS